MNKIIKWPSSFTFKEKKLKYNFSNLYQGTERVVEIPVVVDFIKNLNIDKKRILEVGNTLSQFQNLYSEIDIKSRRIVDKFEVADGVENLDIMTLPASEKYDIIFSISTMEHVGQEYRGPNTPPRDLEAPLKAIVKIYDLLNIGGKALISVPFGKLTDGLFYIQFSKEYLNLLVHKYNIPREALNNFFLKRTALQINNDNPKQVWIEAQENEFDDVYYNHPYTYANGIAFIELTKISEDFVLNLNLPFTETFYDTSIISGGFFPFFKYLIPPDSNGKFILQEKGVILYGPMLKMEHFPGLYEFFISINVDTPCKLILEIIVNSEYVAIFRRTINYSCQIKIYHDILPQDKTWLIRLVNLSDNKITLEMPKFYFKLFKGILMCIRE